jgi:hypothetical protein
VPLWHCIAKEVARWAKLLCPIFRTKARYQFGSTRVFSKILRRQFGHFAADATAKSTQGKIDNVIDWQRLKREVIEPLKTGKPAGWHPFNWTAFERLSPKIITAEPKRVVILDGAFSSRRELQDTLGSNSACSDTERCAYRTHHTTRRRGL